MDGSVGDDLVDGWMSGPTQRWMNKKGRDGCNDVLENSYPSKKETRKPFFVLASNFRNVHTPTDAGFKPPMWHQRM